MDDREARLECLKLAAALVPRGHDAVDKRVVEIASVFYNHITTEPVSAGSSLTALVDKRAKASPTK